MDQRDGPRDLHPILWLGLPVGSLALVWLTPLLGYARWKAFMLGEFGFIETATVAFLIPPIILGVLVFLKRRRLPGGVGWLMLLMAAAALYFAGEEASWGQHWLGFRTPESLADANRQEEFNLHNIYGLGILNEFPRLVMTLACIGAAVLPLVLHRRLTRPEARRGLWYWLIPTWRLVPIAAISVCSTLPEKFVKKVLDLDLPQDHYAYMALVARAGEFKEYCFAIVIFLYALSVFCRQRRWRAPAAPPAVSGG